MKIDGQAVKTCCDGAYPLSDLYCEECGDPLEDTYYRFWIFATLGVAAAIEWWLAASGVLLKFRWPEVFMIESLLLLLAYPTAKLVQRIREPERPVLREMATVFADRPQRIMFMIVWAFIAAIWSGRLPKAMTFTAANLADPRHAPIRHALIMASMVGFALVSVLIVVSQGPRFFDLRIANTLRPERR